MKKILLFSIFILFLCSGYSSADIVYKLSNVPDYEWWYGCSPTAAGMMLAYYDINGYKGHSFDNLIEGEAELSTYPSKAGTWQYNAQYAIASPGHVNDFYRDNDGDGDPYGDSGDDRDPPYHSFNSLADFMGTSQDLIKDPNDSNKYIINPNGATSFYFWTNKFRLYRWQIEIGDMLGLIDKDTSGMYGIWEYVKYRGYDGTLYNQYVDTYVNKNYGIFDNGSGFSFDDFENEILNGRVVMVHVEGHSMLGYGYEIDDNGNEYIFVHDTWKPGDHLLEWGGEYDGRKLVGVTVFIPAVPIPGSIWLVLSGFMVIIVFKLRKRECLV